jgi:hypothetical protein
MGRRREELAQAFPEASQAKLVRGVEYRAFSELKLEDASSIVVVEIVEE